MANYDFARYERNAKNYIAAHMNEYNFHAPRGNKKTGEIPAFNVLPGITCTRESCQHCYKEGCYAIKNGLRAGYTIEKSTILKSWVENTINAFYHLEKLEEDLNKYFSSMAAPRFFRIHSSGEFFSIKYAEMWFRIAKNNPNTHFLAFTKNWRVIREIPFHTLPNVEIVLSGWTGIVIPEDLRAHYHCAWCDDG